MNQIAILGTGDAPRDDAPVPEPIADTSSSFEAVLEAVPGAVFPDSLAARDQCARAYLTASVRAERSGYAGLFINTVGDYGLADVRRTCEIPATGAGEGAVLTALRQGKFGIVSIWPPRLAFIYDAILSATRTRQDCVNVYHLSRDEDLATLEQPENFVTDMQACAATSLQAIREACELCLAQGAKNIVLGCTCMYPVARLLRAEGLPIIEPMEAGYRHLLNMLD